MFHMRTASIRTVQHSLAKVLLWIEAGEKVIITKRNQAIAEIRPLEKKTSKIKCPDFQKQLRATFAHPIRGISNAELISEMRGDR
ncbi:MAG: hypothetical protein A3F67_02425 [Verrucomicrobia bacterium RIFCSPHIGHO2_12_FULL_41_10]|nr:MAG: hypothetical protein A3F67_02425 [Verrucomicrobia bacterium RIFCSPHIGHO2_12_FULL_41_10]